MHRVNHRHNRENSMKPELAAILCSFIIIFFSSCPATQAQEEESHNVFYISLMTDSIDEKIRLLEKSLSSANVYIRQAASDQLVSLMLQETKLSAEIEEIIRAQASGWRADALYVTQNLNRENALSFLLGFEQNAADAGQYILNECEKKRLIFSESELIAIEGHYAVSALRYQDALNSFRAFRADENWPSHIPEIFISYPGLINDLGRAFQYTSSGNEGLNLFLQWEGNLPYGVSDDLRYRLIYWAARVARRMGQNDRAVSLFEQAHVFAPDSAQKDACIWYILDSSMSGPVNNIMERMERLIPLIYSGSAVNDIMERYLHRLVSMRNWRNIIRTYDLIKNIDGLNLKAGFAWVIARAFEEGYLSAEDRQLAAGAQADASVFMRIAYNEGDVMLVPAVYYRMLSADSLNLPFMEFSDDIPETEDFCAAAQFLLGFFENGAADYSIPYIRSLEGTLTPDELRAVACELEKAEMYIHSMRLISLYINNEGYVKNRRDLELMYPRPFLNLIETNAEFFNIAPSLLYGLIRQESAFQISVGSSAGAVGLMQLMQATARDMADRIRRAGGPNFFSANGSVDSSNPEINVYIGSYYYNYLLNLFNNNEQLSLMAYNGGLGRVRQWRNASNLPVDLLVESVTIYETRDYGRRIPALARIYEELYYR